MFIGVLVENTRRNAGDADFLREPVRKLNVVVHSRRSDTAPVAHDEIASRGMKILKPALWKISSMRSRLDWYMTEPTFQQPGFSASCVPSRLTPPASSFTPFYPGHLCPVSISKE